MLTPKAQHSRRTTWAVTGLETGVGLFMVGLVLLYSNPFWRFDEGGFLDWRMHWWNVASEVLVAAGLFVEAVALIGSVAVLVSRFVGRRSWPYVVAALLVCCGVVWGVAAGVTRDLNARL